MASSSKATASSPLELEDFALVGLEAQMAAIARQPGFEAISNGIRQEGYQAGVAEARAEAEQERLRLVEGSVAAVEAFLKEMREARARFQRENTEELLRLSLALARRVLRCEPTASPEFLATRLSECLRQLEGESAYQIRVNPEAVAALEALMTETGTDLFGSTPFKIVGDRRVPAGGIVLEGDQARIESICEAELKYLEEKLVELNRDERAADDG